MPRKDRKDWDVGRFDRWSERYDRSVFQPLFFDRIHRRLSAALSPTAAESVLDVGCGTGRLAERLVSASGCRVTGVDPATGMVREAAARTLARSAFAVAGAEHLPFADGSFDAAISAISAHHWADPAQGFAELARVVRSGGRAVVADVGSLGPVVETMRRLKAIDPEHHRGWAPRELGDHLYTEGFRSVRIRTVRAMGAAVVIASARR